MCLFAVRRKCRKGGIGLLEVAGWLYGVRLVGGEDTSRQGRHDGDNVLGEAIAALRLILHGDHGGEGAFEE